MSFLPHFGQFTKGVGFSLPPTTGVGLEGGGGEGIVVGGVVAMTGFGTETATGFGGFGGFGGFVGGGRWGHFVGFGLAGSGGSGGGAGGPTGGSGGSGGAGGAGGAGGPVIQRLELFTGIQGC